MRTYSIGFIFLVIVSCRNAASHQSHISDTSRTARPPDTTFVLDARDTPAVKTPYVEEPDTTTPQAITLAKRRPGPPLDTVLRIDIDDVSLEGSEVKAHYIQDTLRSAEWQIFGESFQCLESFTFSRDGGIQVKEKNSRYKVPMGEVKSDKDMVTERSTYKLDTNGVILSGEKPDVGTGEMIEIFRAFKKNVPMILRP